MLNNFFKVTQDFKSTTEPAMAQVRFGHGTQGVCVHSVQSETVAGSLRGPNGDHRA